MWFGALAVPVQHSREFLFLSSANSLRKTLLSPFALHSFALSDGNRIACLHEASA